jgi:hypothetical protein
MEELEALLNDILPPADASKWRKGLKAFASIVQEKKIEEIVQYKPSKRTFSI